MALEPKVIFGTVPSAQIHNDMREPNFSESQLQQAVNTALIRRTVERHGFWPSAYVPSLMAEFELGWDTAFYLNWLPNPPSENDQGCNFFIQYKLSGKLNGPTAKEWMHWEKPYFRFKIPHVTRDPSGSYVDDYHQWDRLKALADRSYPTYYATNSTLQKKVIHDALEAGNLLDHIPLLDVRTVDALHKHVTFTSSSNFFALHSEKEEVGKLSFAAALNLLPERKKSTLSASVKELTQALLELAHQEEDWMRDLGRITQLSNQVLPEKGRVWMQYLLLSSFVRKHLGAVLLWLP